MRIFVFLIREGLLLPSHINACKVRGESNYAKRVNVRVKCLRYIEAHMMIVVRDLRFN